MGEDDDEDDEDGRDPDLPVEHGGFAAPAAGGTKTPKKTQKGKKIKEQRAAMGARRSRGRAGPAPELLLLLGAAVMLKCSNTPQILV